MTTEIPMSYYHDEAERLQGILGQSYITSILSGQGAARSLMVLTDRRVYQSGTIFERVQGMKFISSSGKKVVNVRDVTGTSFVELKQPAGIVVCLLFAVLAIADIATGKMAGAIVLALFSGLGFAWYVATRRRLFVVEYAGGAIATDCHWYSPSEIDQFQRSISQIKDRHSAAVT